MKRRSFLQSVALTSLPLTGLAQTSYSKKNTIRLIRHATLVVQIRGVSILVDPMLSEKGQMDPVKNAASQARIPMVDLPFDRDELDKLIASVDAVAVTHTHRDHWDEAAQRLIPKSKIIFCQPVDAEKIRAQGFTDVRPIESSMTWKKVEIHRTSGHHGTGEIEKQMGEVSGFVFIAGEFRIYVAGDTIWCTEVEDAIKKFNPTHVVVNAGGAQFLSGGPITMTPEDVVKVKEHVGKGTVFAVHMDVINHCIVTREILKASLSKTTATVFIPRDGITMYLHFPE